MDEMDKTANVEAPMTTEYTASGETKSEELLVPKEPCYLTIRLIRSFEYKNWKPLVMSNVNLSWTTKELMEEVGKVLKTSALPAAFKTFKGFNRMKVECHRQGSKSNDPLINSVGMYLAPEKTLYEQDIRHETEISFYNSADHGSYAYTRLGANFVELN